MRGTTKRFAPGLEVIEERALLSSAAPLLSPHALDGVVREVRGIMSTLARTGDASRASAALTRLSGRLPSGAAELATAWQGDVGLYRPHHAGSVVVAEARIIDDLDQYDRSGVVATPPASGSGVVTSPSPAPAPVAGGTSNPAPAPSLDSVTIQNTTGLALTVTVHLDVPQVQKPWITETIPAQGKTTALFNFGTATGAFMTIDVGQADGSQSPPPLDDLSLDQPLGGYGGTLFTISLFGPYFNVNPG